MENKTYKVESEIKDYIITTRSKSELADDYGITTKTLKKKVEENGGIYPKDRLLSTKQVKGIVTILGSPKSVFID